MKDPLKRYFGVTKESILQAMGGTKSPACMKMKQALVGEVVDQLNTCLSMVAPSSGRISPVNVMEATEELVHMITSTLQMYGLNGLTDQVESGPSDARKDIHLYLTQMTEEVMTSFITTLDNFEGSISPKSLDVMRDLTQKMKLMSSEYDQVSTHVANNSPSHSAQEVLSKRSTTGTLAIESPANLETKKSSKAESLDIAPVEEPLAQSRIQGFARDLANKLLSLIVERENISPWLIPGKATSDSAVLKDSGSDELFWELVPSELVSNFAEESVKQLLLPLLNPDLTDIGGARYNETSERSLQDFGDTVDMFTKAMVHQIVDNISTASGSTCEKSKQKQGQSPGCAGPVTELKEEELKNNAPLTKKNWKRFLPKVSISFKLKPNLFWMK